MCDIGPLTKLDELPPLTVAEEPSVRRFEVVVVMVPLVSVSVPLTVTPVVRPTFLPDNPPVLSVMFPNGTGEAVLLLI